MPNGYLFLRLGQKHAGSLSHALHHIWIILKTLENSADGAHLLQSPVPGALSQKLHLLVEAERIVLQEELKAGAFNQG